MFSPYYAWARRRGAADPADHCAFNVALYGRPGARWSMTERGRRDLDRDATSFRVGPSSMRWTGERLELTLDEMAAPLPRRIRGRVTLWPQTLFGTRYPLDAAARHHWHPTAPFARVEVALSSPALSWRGEAYLDGNAGDEPLEHGFRRWDWSRGALRDGAAVLYDVTRRDGSGHSLALRFRHDGRTEDFAPPPRHALPRTGWRVARGTRAEPDHAARVVRTLEDTPFYARSLVDTRLQEQDVRMVHESLSLQRFDTAWVQALLPFRMPRRAR